MREIFGIAVPILPVHIAVVFAVLTIVILADHEGFSWVRGKKETLDARRLAHYHRLIWIFLCLLIFTGILLFLPLRDYLLATAVFYMKMTFVAALIINSFVIGRFIRVATERSFQSLSKKERLPLFISGVVSGVSWVGVVVAALNLGL